MKKLMIIALAAALLAGLAHAQTVHVPKLHVGKSKLTADGIAANTLTVGDRKEVQVSYDEGRQQAVYGIKYGSNSVSFGAANSVEAIYAVAMGSGNVISEWGPFSLALGQENQVGAPYGIALGQFVDLMGGSDGSFVWNGDVEHYGPHNRYASRGPGTFCVNPSNGPAGFFVGTTNLSDIIGAKVVSEIQYRAVPREYDTNWNGTALTIGNRLVEQTGGDDYNPQYGTIVGEGSVANGSNVTAKGSYAHAEGYYTGANAPYSHSGGVYSEAPSFHDYAYVWNGDTTSYYDGNRYQSMGPGTYCVNPVGGADGFFIGTNKLSSLLGGGGSGVHSLKMFTDDYNSSIQGAEYISSFPYQLEWSDGSELYFILGDSASSTTHMIYVPSITQRGLCGRMALYLSQNPYSDAHYTVSGGVHGLPYPEPWMDGTNKAIWKVEIEAIPGSSEWYYIGATEYESPYFYEPNPGN